MQNVHPTETGGDGKPLRKFATPKPGDILDDRIRCAECGFAFRMTRDTHGDSKDSPGILIAPLTVAINNTQSKLPIHLQGIAAFKATSRVIQEPTVNSGCRLCGTYNPTGKQSREFDTFNKDMSGR